jgi:hypothetical protein
VAETTVIHFYAAGLDALVKRSDKCINVGGGYVEIMFFPGSNIIYFTFYINFWPVYLLFLVLTITRVLVNQTFRKAMAKRKNTKKHIHMKEME